MVSFGFSCWGRVAWLNASVSLGLACLGLALLLLSASLLWGLSGWAAVSFFGFGFRLSLSSRSGVEMMLGLGLALP